jgi:hypothetical protein
MAGNRSSLLSKIDDEDEYLDPDDHRVLVNFSTTSYAVLEREQRVDLKIKRTGPINVAFRFRCLYLAHSLSHSCMHML